MHLRKGKVVNNRYRIIERLGQGGFGAVYLAEDLTRKTKCAIKENLDDSENTIGKFLREASMLYNLEHPNLPAVWDHFVIAGEGQYLVMEYVEGISLSDILAEEGKPLEVQEVVDCIIQVCDALSYLHSQRPPIIHRDIKPGNIRITKDGKVVLVDFGIAKFYDEFSRTSTVARAVTPGYSPLEQYGLGRTDARSDIYALGVTTYKLLTNEMPPPSVDVAAGTAPPAPPAHEINPDISISMAAAIGRTMRLRVENRTSSAAQFKHELQSSMTAIYNKRRTLNRLRRVAFWLLVLLITALLIFAIASAYLIASNGLPNL